MNQEEQIIYLNSTIKATLAPSKIHGIGVFAVVDILKGQKTYCIPNLQPRWFTISQGSFDKLFPEVKELIITRWPSVKNGSHFLSPNDMVWLITFMNHSDNPNYDVDTDCALQNIKKGEEITEDYRRMDNYEKIYPFLKI